MGLTAGFWGLCVRWCGIGSVGSQGRLGVFWLGLPALWGSAT